MKYALFLFLTLFVQNTFALTLTSFTDSPELMNVLEFVKDAGSDLKISHTIVEKKINIKDYSKCVKVSSAQVFSDIEEAILNVLRFYPDEELPLEYAYNDLVTYLGSFSYLKCSLQTSTNQKEISTQYYENSTGSIHIRVDKITLLDQ